MTTPFTVVKGSASIGASEYFILSASTSPTYQTNAVKRRAYIDLSNMIAGDCYQITPYDKVDGGAVLAIGAASYPTGVQTGAFVVPEEWTNEGWEIGIKLLTGSARVVGWAVKEDSGDRNVVGITAGLIDATAAPNLDAAVSSRASSASMVTALSDLGALLADVGTSIPSAAAIASQVVATAIEGAHSLGDVLRGIFRLQTAKKRGYDTGTVVVRDAADTKDSMTITTDSTGVTSTVYHDLT